MFTPKPEKSYNKESIEICFNYIDFATNNDIKCLISIFLEFEVLAIDSYEDINWHHFFFIPILSEIEL